ncbi:MAG: peptide-methionine (S)-S-oxide reductase MsrA [Balneolia bacterium]|nr:peptide-methionine (S)-S-oxide reductase MsrA [Balneolia bacterium]
MKTLTLLMMALFAASVISLAATVRADVGTGEAITTQSDYKDMPDNLETAVFGNGCFWCTEAVFQRVRGVHSVVSGYAGGHVENPTYRQVTTGTTGHAEVIQIKYDPSEVDYDKLLQIFFRTHNPTTLNRQGNDIGPQYRSIILYSSEEQKSIAEDVKQRLGEAEIWPDPIVTEITPLDIFYEAEDYHQNYFNRNSDQAYCQVVIVPKLEKFERLFQDRVAQ